MPKLSIIICCYNERATIREVIEATHQVDFGPAWEREILVVDNFSTDGTREILKALDLTDVRVFYHDRNRGKGMSIRTAIAAMSGDYMVIQDADKEYDPHELARLTALATETKAPAIFGSRVLGGDVRYEYAHAYLGVRLLTWLCNLLFGGHLTDVATATKMVRADVVQSLNLTCTSFDLDFELPSKIFLAGHDIIEIPISYDPRTYAEGKKISSRDGLRAIVVMVRDRLGLTPVFQQDAAQPIDQAA